MITAKMISTHATKIYSLNLSHVPGCPFWSHLPHIHTSSAFRLSEISPPSIWIKIIMSKYWAGLRHIWPNIHLPPPQSSLNMSLTLQLQTRWNRSSLTWWAVSFFALSGSQSGNGLLSIIMGCCPVWYIMGCWRKPRLKYRLRHKPPLLLLLSAKLTKEQNIAWDVSVHKTSYNSST